MDKLTYDFEVGTDHCWQARGADNALCEEVCKKYSEIGCKECPIGHAFDRLAAYEDTGMEPDTCANYKQFEDEVISKCVTFKHILELLEAEQDGRLVVLPEQRKGK